MSSILVRLDSRGCTGDDCNCFLLESNTYLDELDSDKKSGRPHRNCHFDVIKNQNEKIHKLQQSIVPDEKLLQHLTRDEHKSNLGLKLIEMNNKDVKAKR